MDVAFSLCTCYAGFDEGDLTFSLIIPLLWNMNSAWMVIGVVFFLLILGVLAWRAWLIKKKLHTALDHLRQMNEQLIDSEKMAALGGLVAGFAHEINTPVGIGITASSSLTDETERMANLYQNGEISREAFREFLQSTYEAGMLIRKNLERTAMLLQSFKLVSLDQVSEQQRVFRLKSYLNDIITSLLPKYKHKNIRFMIECPDDLELNSFPGAYAQVFTNLLLNSFSHGFRDKEAGMVTILVERTNGMIHMQYSDDGSGIADEDLPRIFEPFYTSDKRKGSGMGLNIVYNIVKKKLHGMISCESIPGKGVHFKIDIPLNPPIKFENKADNK